jgi:hypothetical protein
VENHSKVRVYELAHEFDVTTQVVLEACVKAGLNVKSHSGTIEDADVWAAVKAVKAAAQK